MESFIRKGKWLEYQISKQMEGLPVEEILRETLQVSGRLLQKLTRKSGIQLNGKKSHLAARVKAGDRLQVLVFEREGYGVTPEPISLDISYEDEHILVVNKDPGIAVHPTEPGHAGTLAHGIAYHYQLQGIETKVRHIHRLDKDTSGLLLVAKHALAHAILDDKLRERKIKRRYLAIASGIFKNQKGTINLPIGRDRHHPTRRRVSPNGDEAITHYEVLEQYSHGALLALELETGRTHQIRVHLSHMGHPLYGDLLYGGPAGLISRQALHAERLLFEHPLTKEKLELTAALPADMKTLLQRLRS